MLRDVLIFGDVTWYKSKMIEVCNRIGKQSTTRTPMFDIKHYFAGGKLMVDKPGNISLVFCGEEVIVRRMRYPIYILDGKFIPIVFRLPKLLSAVFEINFSNYYLEVNTDVFSVHINCKRSRRRGNIKRDSFPSWFIFHSDEIFSWSKQK